MSWQIGCSMIRFLPIFLLLEHYFNNLETFVVIKVFTTSADATAAATAGDTNESRIVQTMSDQMNFVRYLAERMNVAKSKFSDREKRLEHFKELLSRPIMSEKTGTLSGDLNTTGPVGKCFQNQVLCFSKLKNSFLTFVFENRFLLVFAVPHFFILTISCHFPIQSV